MVVELAAKVWFRILVFTLWASFNPSGLFLWLCNTVLSILISFTNADNSVRLAPRAKVPVISMLRNKKKKVSLAVLRADQRRRWFELMYPHRRTSARRNRQRKNGKLHRATNAAIRNLIYANISVISLPGCMSAPCSFMPHGEETASRNHLIEQSTSKDILPCWCSADASEFVISETGGFVQGADITIVDELICDDPCGVRPTCKSLDDVESVRGSDPQGEAKAGGHLRLMRTSDHQHQMAAMQERAPRLLRTCTAVRTATRFLLLLFYSCLLRCFSCAGAAAATALAYFLTLLASQVLSLPHGSWCRLATTTAASAPVAQLWNMHMGACVFTIVVFLPLPWLWWSPTKCYARSSTQDDKLLEKFNEVVNWAKANLDLLRIREGDCFKSKLRQLNGDEEKRIYNFLNYHQKNKETSATLAAQFAKLDCMVKTSGDTGLHTDAPSADSESRKARSFTEAGLSAQEEGGKRTKLSTKTKAKGLSFERSDTFGSASTHKSDLVTIKDILMKNTEAMSAAVRLCTSSGSGEARSSGSASSGAQESSSSRMTSNLPAAAESTRPLRTDDLLHQTGPYDHFERQSGAWCGMHALNNLLRGPMVNKEACRLAAQRVRESFAGADVESAHLDPQTGFLSIDVINLLGSANLGIHVEETPTAWEVFRHCHGARALINWNQRHWTVLEAWPPDAPTRWRHTNSIDHVSSNLRYGRAH